MLELGWERSVCIYHNVPFPSMFLTTRYPPKLDSEVGDFVLVYFLGSELLHEFWAHAASVHYTNVGGSIQTGRLEPIAFLKV